MSSLLVQFHSCDVSGHHSPPVSTRIKMCQHTKIKNAKTEAGLFTPTISVCWLVIQRSNNHKNVWSVFILTGCWESWSDWFIRYIPEGVYAHPIPHLPFMFKKVTKILNTKLICYDCFVKCPRFSYSTQALAGLCKCTVLYPLKELHLKCLVQPPVLQIKAGHVAYLL